MSTSLVDLSVLVPGKIPVEIFNAIAHITVTPVIELIITDGVAVILRRRLDTDTYWPNQYCIPGSIIYSGGPKSLEGYLNKILIGFGIKTEDAHSELVGVEVYTTKRGDEVAIIYKTYVKIPCELNDDLYIIKLKDIGTLDLITEHRDILRKYLIK